MITSLKSILTNKRKRNFLQSFLLNRKTQSSFSLYGKIKLVIAPSAKITTGSEKIHLNGGARFSEPFSGVLEMLPQAKLTILGKTEIYAGMHVIIGPKAQLYIGSGFINRHVQIRCFDSIHIGKQVTISENVMIWDTDAHEVLREGYRKSGPVTIGDKVWIGANVTILKGVSIGANSIIGAGALVNKSIPANCMAAGNPAKVIKEDVSWQ